MSVPKGKTAPIVHGDEVVKLAMEYARKEQAERLQKAESVSLRSGCLLGEVDRLKKELALEHERRQEAEREAYRARSVANYARW